MFKKNLKKALSLFASLLILCTMLPLSAMLSAGADETNVVVNGGFENGKDGWSCKSGTSEIVTDANSGTNALKLTNPGQWGEGAVQTVSVDANGEYQIVWYSKRIEGTGAFNLYVMNASGYANLKTVSGQNWMNEASGNWVKNEYVVKTEDATSVILKFSTESVNPGSILLDDITMIKVGGEEPTPDEPADSSANLLKNGDFETGEIAPWDNLWGSNTVSIVDGRDSQYAMSVVSGQWKHVRQVVEVEANTDYVITGWYKDVTDMTLLVKDGNDVANLHQLPMSGSDWIKVTLEFNSRNNTSLIVSLMGNVAESKGIFDDFSMTKVGGDEPEVPEDPAENMLSNGDFETGEVKPWDNLWGSNTATIVEGRDSQYGLHVVSGQWKHVRQVVTVEPNTDYVVTGWYKDVTDMTLLIKDGNDAVNVKQAHMNGGADWTQSTVEFNSGDYTSVIVSLMGNVAESQGTFDDFVMYKKGGSTPDEPVEPDSGLINGTFEKGDLSGWLPSQNTAISTDAKKNGSYGANLKGDGGWGGLLDQNLTVSEGKEYVLTFWYKAIAGGANFVIKHDGASVTSYYGAATEWTQITLEFTAPADSLLLNICGGGTGVAENIFVDDFVLTEKGGDEPVVPSTGLVQNGDFETGDDTGWNIHQTTAIVGDAAHGGSYGAHLQGIGGWGGMLDQTISTEFGTTYVLTYWIKALSSGANVQVVNSSNNEVLVSDWTDTAKAADWTQKTLEFTAIGDETLINFCGGGNGVAESVYVDDIVVEVKPDEPDEPDQPVVSGGMQNGDFETGDNTGWGTHQSTVISGDAAHGGSYGAHLKGNGGWGGMLTQTIAVESGKSYILSYWVKMNATGVNFQIKADNDSGAILASGWIEPGSAANWVQKTFEFTATSDAAFINFCGSGTNSAEDLYVDDVTLSEKSAAPTELVNGDFEDGTNGWVIGGNTALSTDAYSGSSSLLLSHDSAWGEAAYQIIALEKNTDYTLTWYSKRVSGEGAYMVSPMNEANFDQKVKTVDGQNWFNHTSTEWTKTEYTFNTGEFNEIRFKFCPEAAGAGSFLIDGITLVKAGEEPVDPTGNMIKNGDFESGTDGWKWATNTKLDTENAYTGAASARLDHDSAYGEALTQMIKLQPNTDYVIIYYTKRVSGHGAWDLFLMDGDTINSASPVNIEVTGGQKWFQQGIDAGWVKTRLEFNSGEMTKAFVKFGPEAADSGVFLLDDVGMYVKGNEPEEPEEPVIPVSGMTLTSYGVLNNRPITADKNMLLNGSFESTGGQWDVETFHTENVSVVADSTTKFGGKSLFFNTSTIAEENAVTTVFWMEVTEDTSYVFSTWLKGGFLADDNRGRATIGVVDENGKFLALSDELFLDGTRQLVPTAWDNQWHLRSVEFNAGSHTKIGIAMAGWGSKMWIDDMALFEVGNGIKYMSENMAGGVQLSYDFSYIGCDDEDSLIPDPNFKKGEKTAFWQSSYGWRNNFMSYVDNPYEYGASLKYTSTGDKAATHIIKWIDVEPETQYTFAVDIKIMEDGFGKIVLLDNKKRDKVPFFTVSFDSYDYDDYENTGWRTVVTSFNTDVYDKIGIAFVDDGGEVLIDNMRFFKNTDGKDVVDYYIEPPADPDDFAPDAGVDDPIDDPNGGSADEGNDTPSKPSKPKPAPAGVDPSVWIWIGAGSAVALAGAAIAIILLLNKRKKKDQAAAAAAAEQAAESQPLAEPEQPAE